eukprot:EG_transcript_10124
MHRGFGALPAAVRRFSVAGGAAVTTPPARHVPVAVVGSGATALCTALRFALQGCAVSVFADGPSVPSSTARPISLLHTSAAVPFCSQRPALRSASRWWFLKGGPSKLSPATRDALQTLHGRSLPEYQSLLADCGVPAERYLRTGQGMLLLYETDHEFQRDVSHRRWMKASHIRHGALLAPQAQALEGQLRADCLSHAVLLCEEAFIDNAPALLQALQTTLQRLGGTVLSSPVLDVRVAGGTPEIVTGAGTFTARLLVVAPEDHAARYAAALGDRIPLQDSVTHSEEWRVDGALGRPLVLPERSVAICPSNAGVVASSFVLSPRGKAAKLREEGMPPALEAAITAVFSGGKVESVRRWENLSCTTPDSLPVIGRSPRHEAVVYACGHGELAFGAAAVTSRLAWEAATGRTPSIPLEPYRPERFVSRLLARH